MDNQELQAELEQLRKKLRAAGELPDKWRAVTGENPIGPLYGAGICLAAKGCADELEAVLKD